MTQGRCTKLKNDKYMKKERGTFLENLTKEDIAFLLDFDPISGEFVWKNPKSPSIHRGDRAGVTRPTGYRVIKINSRPIMAHRLAWMLYYGKWPEGDVDHLNGNRADNRICNLRCVSRRENTANRIIHRMGKIPGVTRKGNKWEAGIKINDTYIFLGTRDTEASASELRNWAVANQEFVFSAYKEKIEKRKSELAMKPSHTPVYQKAKRTKAAPHPIGIYYREKQNNWKAIFCCGGSHVYLGVFPTKEAALLRQAEYAEEYAKLQQCNFVLIGNAYAGQKAMTTGGCE